MVRTLLVVAVFLPVLAQAQIVVDTLYITDQQIYFDARGNWIDGSGIFGTKNDLQVVDDFTVAGGGEMWNWFTEDFLTFGIANATQALVEVFPSKDGAPVETPLHSGVFDITRTETFTDTLYGLVGRRYTVELPAWYYAARTTYFISMQPISEDWGYTPRGKITSGGESYMRDSGIDHGNGYQGGYMTEDFRRGSQLGFGAGDVAMKVDLWIPEPGTALLGLAAMLLGRAPR